MKLQKIPSDSNRCKKLMRLPAIIIQTSRDPGVDMTCLNCTLVNCVTKLNWKSKVNTWYTSGDFQEAKELLGNGFSQLEDGIDYTAMGLK